MTVRFEGEIKKWAIRYLRKRHWRLANVFDQKDLEQEAYLVFLKVLRLHPELDHHDFFRLFRVRMYFHLCDKAKACFPNTFNVSSNPVGRCISLTEIDGGDLLDRMAPSTDLVIGDVGDYLDVIKKLPEELRSAYSTVMREALGIEEIPALLRKRLGQKRRTPEPINLVLSRLHALDPKRDLLDEISTLVEEAMSIQTEVLEVLKLKRKSGEAEQDFLTRVVKKLDKADEEEFFKLSAGARNWFDRACVALEEGEEIPPIDGKVKTKPQEADVDEDEDDVKSGPEDEDEDEEQDTDEDEDEEEDDEKPQAAKKVEAAKVKAKKSDNAGGRRGRAPTVTDDMVIQVVGKSNPNKEGTKKHKIYEIFESGMKVSAFRKKAMAAGLVKDGLGTLRDARKQGHITLTAAE